VVARVDEQGREVAARCAGSERVLERYPLEYRSWAESAGRPLLGAKLSPICPPAPDAESAAHMTFPRDGQTFVLDPDGPTRQEIMLTAASSARHAHFVVDGVPSRELAPPFRMPWRLSTGQHTAELEANGSISSRITFSVADGP
jgi:hypothetical protein